MFVEIKVIYILTINENKTQVNLCYGKILECIQMDIDIHT